jgi:hypothetical protein
MSPIGDIPANEDKARPLTRIRDTDGNLDLPRVEPVWAGTLTT